MFFFHFFYYIYIFHDIQGFILIRAVLLNFGLKNSFDTANISS